MKMALVRVKMVQNVNQFVICDVISLVGGLVWNLASCLQREREGGREGGREGEREREREKERERENGCVGVYICHGFESHRCNSFNVPM